MHVKYGVNVAWISLGCIEGIFNMAKPVFWFITVAQRIVIFQVLNEHFCPSGCTL